MSEIADVGGSGGYDPAAFARPSPPDESGTGVKEKHPVATLRVFSGADDAEWLLYGGIQGGRQGRGWVEVFYRGIVTWQGEPTFGDWSLRVEGEGLEPLAHQLGRQVRTTLKVGAKEDSISVRRIEIRPLRLVERED